jgi:glyoxylase-like metal-dependent hydrolase (beta-lactamase superfamily II)
MRITTFALLSIALPLSFILKPVAHAQEPAPSTASQPFSLKPLGHNVYAAIDNPKGEAGANAGFVIGDDGVLVIDSFENPEAAKIMLAEIRKLTALPIKYVVNTHYHLDHVAGNGVFAKEGAVIVAHRNVPTWIHTENLKFFGKDIKPEEKATVEGLVSPGLVYDTEIEILLGSRRVFLNYFPGHTGGDTVVAIPDAKGVVFCGDLFWRNTLPNLIDATTGLWIPTLEKLARSHADATFVPGHGDVGNAADVNAFRGYLSDLRASVAGPVKAGKSGDDLVNAVMPKLTEKYGKWNFFEYFAKTDILFVGAELRGDKKNPQPEDTARAAMH